MSNKFPQLEWITVDGRPTPVPKVQHYKEGSTTETELTGHDNPFPVANYTQNSNGLWLPVSEDNPVPTRLTGSNIEDGQAIPVRETNGITVLRVDSGVEVTAGSRSAIGYVDAINTPYISIAIRTDVSHAFSIDIDWRNLYERRWGTVFYETKIEEVESNRVIGVDKHPVYTDNCSVFIRNDSEEDRVYDVFILGKEG